MADEATSPGTSSLASRRVVCKLVVVEEPDADDFEDEMMLYDSGAARWALLIIGTISVVLGVIGLLLPIVPTTPFLVVAAACYARSSRKFYMWLMTNRWFGKYLRDWRAGKGIPLYAKIGSTVVIVASFGTSAVLFVPVNWGKVLMIAVGIAALVYVWWQPTAQKG